MLNIIKRDVLNLFRDKSNVFFLIFFPSVLVFLLGNLLANLDFSDNAIEPITIQYTVQTDDHFTQAAVSGLAGAVADIESLSMQENTDYADAKTIVENGDAASAVAFTGDNIEIYQGMDKIQNRAVDSIMKGFSRQTASLKALSEQNPELLAQAAATPAEGLVQQKELGYSRTMLDYYAVAMIVMILFMGGAIGGASDLYESRRNGTLRRMLATPRSRASIYVQSVLGAVPQNVLQVLCVMLASTLLFGAHYADSFADNMLLLLTMFIAGLCVTALSMLLGLFINMNPIVIIMPLMWGLMFISGTFSKEVYIKGVTELSPIWQIQNAAFDLTVFGRSEKCLAVIGICSVLIIVSTAIGALLFNRKGVVIK